MHHTLSPANSANILFPRNLVCFRCIIVKYSTVNKCDCLFVFWLSSPQWARPSSFTRFLDHTQRRTTVGRTPLDEWSARRRDLYLTTHNTHKRQTSMPPVGFEPTISAGERPQTYTLDRAATGTGIKAINNNYNNNNNNTNWFSNPNYNVSGW